MRHIGAQPTCPSRGTHITPTKLHGPWASSITIPPADGGEEFTGPGQYQGPGNAPVFKSLAISCTAIVFGYKFHMARR